MDELVAVERKLEALDCVKDRLQQVLLTGDQVLKDTKGTKIQREINRKAKS